MLRDLAVNMFDRIGYELETAASGEEAIERLAESTCGFDLLITDYSMPGMSGLDLAREVKVRCPNLPIIMCTGYGADIDTAAVAETGICKIVCKPFNRAELTRMLDDVLSKGLIE